MSYKFWYNDDDKRIARSTAFDVLSLTVSPPKFSNISLAEACVERAHEVYCANPKIHIAYDGSWYSRVCIWSFIAAGYVPNIVVFSYEASENLPKLTNYCEASALEYVSIQVPAPTYDQLLEFAVDSKYQGYTRRNAHQMYLSQAVDFPVLFSDSIAIERNPRATSKWGLIIHECDLWPVRFNTANHMYRAVNDFFSGSSDIISAVANMDCVNTVITNPVSGKMSLRSITRDIYVEGFGSEHPLVRDGDIHTLPVNRASMIDYNSRQCCVDYETLRASFSNNKELNWKCV